jgi:uncharacterized membrane protein (UPF0127 family)
MNPTPLYNVTRKRAVAGRVERPAGFWRRSLGLLVRPPLAPGEALWLDPCGGIHTWGLRVPIDVLFLDRELTVLRVAREVRPWRWALAPAGTRSVVELPAGAAGEVRVGDRLRVGEVEGSRLKVES